MGDVCRCCGAPQVEAGDPIVAAADVLVMRALELVGKRVVKQHRSRYQALRDGGRPWHEAHVLWPPDDGTVDAALAVAWDTIPVLVDAHGCCGLTPDRLRVLLDQYVRDLLLTRQPHRLLDLRWRLGEYLGLPVAG